MQIVLLAALLVTQTLAVVNIPLVALFSDGGCSYFKSSSFSPFYPPLDVCNDEGFGHDPSIQFNVSCATESRSSPWTMTFFDSSVRACKGNRLQVFNGVGSTCNSAQGANFVVDCSGVATGNLDDSAVNYLCPASSVDNCFSYGTNSTSCNEDVSCNWCSSLNLCQYRPTIYDCSYTAANGVGYYFPNTRTCGFDNYCNITQFTYCTSSTVSANCAAHSQCMPCNIEVPGLGNEAICIGNVPAPCRLLTQAVINTAGGCPVFSVWSAAAQSSSSVLTLFTCAVLAVAMALLA